jgi:hypothetical protein
MVVHDDFSDLMQSLLVLLPLPIPHVPFFSSASQYFISVCAPRINGGIPIRAVRCAPPGGGYGLFGAGGFYQNNAAGGLDTEPFA